MLYAIDWEKTEYVASTALAFTQIAFYLSASAVAWLTFAVARKGLLSPVNTEYQKRVMDRLSEIATELGDEWNPKSDACYIHHGEHIHDACADVDDQYDKYKRGEVRADEIGIKVSPLETRFIEQFNRWRSDPFLPEKLRYELLDFTIKRKQTYSNIYFSEVGKYRKSLVRQNEADPRPSWVTVNNAIHARLSEAGFGLDDVSRKADVLRLSIQAYMQRYDPTRRPSLDVRVYSPTRTGLTIIGPEWRFIRKIGDEDTAI